MLVAWQVILVEEVVDWFEALAHVDQVSAESVAVAIDLL